MSLALAEFTENLVSISDFSQGKAGKIFSDVAENNREYIVLKNNQPTAVVISIENYKDTQRRIARLEAMLEKLENIRLEQLAKSRAHDNTTSFSDLVREEGFTMDELERVAENIDVE